MTTTNLIKPAHMPWISPCLIAKDTHAILEFYQRAFGFELTDEIVKDDNGKILHAALRHEQGIIMVGLAGHYEKENITVKSPANDNTVSYVNLYVYCKNVDELYAQAKASGAKVTRELQNAFWGDRMCSFVDPEGYQWTFATYLGEG